jgi:hypothetical protein
MWIRLKNATGLVDKMVLLSTAESTLIRLLSTKLNAIVKTYSEINILKSLQARQRQFSSFEKTKYPRQLERKIEAPHKSPNSTYTTSYYIYNI